jgi:hypothetical protein
MPSGNIAVNWPVPTGLGYIKKNTAISIKAIFSWDKITDAELDIVAGTGVATLAYWRVRINNNRTFLVYNNPTFTLELPLGCCKICVEVQSIYTFSAAPTVLAQSSYCNEVCVECRVDPYCSNRKKSGNVSRPNVGSRNMRYARAISNGGLFR